MITKLCSIVHDTVTEAQGLVYDIGGNAFDSVANGRKHNPNNKSSLGTRLQSLGSSPRETGESIE